MAASVLRLHAHRSGTLVSLADYLYGLTGGYIVSLSRLIREAAIYAILTGIEASASRSWRPSSLTAGPLP